MNYVLPEADEIYEALCALLNKRDNLKREYEAVIADIDADAAVMRTELELLKLLGKVD